MKILCTGNPDSTDKPTIASGVRKIFPDADFAHKGTGYDLTFSNINSVKHFQNQIKKYDIFLNCSYINQCRQLEMAFESCFTNGKPTNVINIGSSVEFDGSNITNWQYRLEKIKLRDTSITFCGPKFKSTILTCYGINDSVTHTTGLDVLQIANTIRWILDQEIQVPVVCIRNS